MSPPKCVRRIRRRAMGGTFDVRVYADGSSRIRVDHPSNDPEIEFAMAGRALKVIRAIFAEHGLAEPKIQPMTWRDDPPRPVR